MRRLEDARWSSMTMRQRRNVKMGQRENEAMGIGTLGHWDSGQWDKRATRQYDNRERASGQWDNGCWRKGTMGHWDNGTVVSTGTMDTCTMRQ